MSEIKLTELEKRTVDRLLEKSQEAFLLAIELYNRPTIRYHAEGCAYFLCNAWELMLKAYLIQHNGEESVYYPNSERTLSLSDCLSKVITNERDPVRNNLDILIDFRNVSTHFVTDEYELFYGPILQICVQNYESTLNKLLHIEISDKIPENYLSLSVRRGSIEPESLRARYSKQVVEKMIRLGSEIAVNESVKYHTDLRLTKKDADFSVKIDNKAESSATILKVLTQPIDKYVYRTKTGTVFISNKLKSKNIVIKMNGVEKPEFNTYMFRVFVDFYQMKSNEYYAYNFALEGEQPSYGYSQQAVDLMIQECVKDPERVIDGMRYKLKERKSRPQEQGNSNA